MTPKKKILIISSAAKSLVTFRRDFILNLVENNYEVICATTEPNKYPRTAALLKELNVEVLEYPLQRTGLNPFKDLQTLYVFYKIIKKRKIDLVFPYTIKPVIYGSMAAGFLKVPVISLISGLGYTFSGTSKKARGLQKITEILYRTALKRNKSVVFQNKDDLNLFLERGIFGEEKESYVVNGSGINLNEYTFRTKEVKTSAVRFVLVARLIKEKGIFLFVEAAQKLKREFPDAEFHVIGTPGNSPSAISEDVLKQLNEDAIIVYHGHQDKVLDLLAKSDVFVLPTFYREGVPRSILEALSVGMPIITTETPGCRETIEEDKNGILIAPQNIDDLVNAMTFFLKNPETIKEMGIQSRKLADEKFNVTKVNETLLRIIQKHI